MTTSDGPLCQSTPVNTSHSLQVRFSHLFAKVNGNTKKMNRISPTTTNNVSPIRRSKLPGPLIRITAISLLILVAVFVPIIVSSKKSVATTTTTILTATIITIIDNTTSDTTMSMINNTAGTITITTTRFQYVCAGMTMLVGYDLPGRDITSKNLSSHSMCCSWCRSYTGCKAYSWGLPTAGWAAYTCFIKNGLPSRRASSVLVSAYY